MTSKAPAPTFDVAISSVEYDVRVLRELERRLSHRLPNATGTRAIWTSAAELDDVPRSTVFGRSARVAVVLHQHLWGKDAVTRSDAAAIRRRLMANGPESVRVVTLDRTSPPVWLAGVPTRALGERDLDACADWIADAVAECGGVTRPRAVERAVADAASEERSAQQRDSFLGSHRATTHLTRELERLADEVMRRVEAVRRADAEAPLEVQRMPGRCAVQLGPVALTLSWVRTRPDSVATGRLMVIEWEGRIGRATAGGGPVARPIRETVLRADATRVDDWHWRSDDVSGYAYDSSELAAHCVDSLTHAFEARGGSTARRDANDA